MAIHLKEVSIEKYRGLKAVKLKNLNHINIITGKNNTGKTSILEVLYTLNNPLWGESWFQAVYSRQAGVSIFSEMQRMIPFDNNEINYSIRWDKDDNIHKINLKALLADTMITNRELMRVNGYIQTGAPKAENEIPYPTKQLQLTLMFDEEKREFGLYEQQTAINTRGKDKDTLIPVIYLSPYSHNVNAFGTFLKPIFEENVLYEGVLDVLKGFDENIIGLNLLNNECYVNIKNYKKAVPLSTYGDGLKKAIVIMCAIAISRDGLLLIDEFETSVHLSIIPEMFESIIKAAEKFNVQLFMSSHSENSILALLNSNVNRQKDYNLYTLFEKDNKTLVRKLNGDSAIDVASWGVRL